MEDIQNGHAVLTKPTAMILDPADGKEKSCKDYIREKVVQTEAYQHTTAAGKTEIDFITYVNDKRLSAPGLITHTAYCKPRDARDGRNAFSPRLSVYATMHKPGGTPEYFRIDIFDDLTRNEKTSLMKTRTGYQPRRRTGNRNRMELSGTDSCAGYG